MKAANGLALIIFYYEHSGITDPAITVQLRKLNTAKENVLTEIQITSPKIFHELGGVKDIFLKRLTTVKECNSQLEAYQRRGELPGIGNWSGGRKAPNDIGRH